VDSALVLRIAVDALGPKRVDAVIMPSPHSSAETQEDARELARRLDVNVSEVPIAGVMKAYDTSLASAFAGLQKDVTEENIQARIRGNILMAYSNKFGSLLLSTGNKSEMAVGYTTLYGDMAGGFAVIKDVPKTDVYACIRWRNRDGLVPERIISRSPSAELRPGQVDQDSLPPYEVLDPILEGYIEGDMSEKQLVAQGFDQAIVARVIALVDGAEHKRRQGPIGPKVTTRAFGRDRRMPVANGFRDRLRAVRVSGQTADAVVRSAARPESATTSAPDLGRAGLG
jgi:NAD+ synthase (glutamine-hydrolysing)